MIIIVVCLHGTLAKLIAAFIAASFERLPSSDEIWHHSQSNLQTLRLSLTGGSSGWLVLGWVWPALALHSGVSRRYCTPFYIFGVMAAVVSPACSPLYGLQVHKPPPLFTVVKIPILRRGPHHWVSQRYQMKVVDKLHMAGHTDTWCRQHCDPKSFKELDDVCYIYWDLILLCKPNLQFYIGWYSKELHNICDQILLCKPNLAFV